MRYLLIICLFFVSTVSADVYRSTDKEGNVVFSDEASPDAEKVIIPETQTIPPPSTGGTGYRPPAKKYERYKKLAVISPENDAPIRDNAGNLKVSVNVQPDLYSNDQLVLYMDGKEVGAGKSTVFTLQNVDRGTHQLRAVIKDRDGKIRKSSKSVSFHMLRFFARPGS